MKFADTVEAEQSQQTKLIRMPAGLLGLEQIKEYELVANPAEDPLVWLQSIGTPDVSFLLISPFIVIEDYRPDISNEDADWLGLESAEDAVIYNIVTLRGPAAATVNLKGPVVVNRHTNVAKQVILNNAADYSVRHPIATA